MRFALNSSPPPPSAAESPPASGPRPLAGVGRALGAERLYPLGAASALSALREVGCIQLCVEVGVGELVADGHPSWSDRGVTPEQVDSGTKGTIHIYLSVRHKSVLHSHKTT